MVIGLFSQILWRMLNYLKLRLRLGGRRRVPKKAGARITTENPSGKLNTLKKEPIGRALGKTTITKE